MIQIGLRRRAAACAGEVTRRVAMSSGERVEVVIDFSQYPIGTQLFLTDAAAGPGDAVRRDRHASPTRAGYRRAAGAARAAGGDGDVTHAEIVNSLDAGPTTFGGSSTARVRPGPDGRHVSEEHERDLAGHTGTAVGMGPQLPPAPRAVPDARPQRPAAGAVGPSGLKEHLPDRAANETVRIAGDFPDYLGRYASTAT